MRNKMIYIMLILIFYILTGCGNNNNANETQIVNADGLTEEEARAIASDLMQQYLDFNYCFFSAEDIRDVKQGPNDTYVVCQDTFFHSLEEVKERVQSVLTGDMLQRFSDTYLSDEKPAIYREEDGVLMRSIAEYPELSKTFDEVGIFSHTDSRIDASMLTYGEEGPEMEYMTLRKTENGWRISDIYRCMMIQYLSD